MMQPKSSNQSAIHPGSIPQDLTFPDFKVEVEEWNEYKLRDGSTLKTKFVLINLLLDSKYKEIMQKAKTDQPLRMFFDIQSQNMIGIEPANNLRGPPDTMRYTTDELRSFVVEFDIDFDTIAEKWSTYDVEGLFAVKVRSRPTNINRTSKFDSRGFPIYVVDSGFDVKVIYPVGSAEIDGVVLDSASGHPLISEGRVRLRGVIDDPYTGASTGRPVEVVDYFEVQSKGRFSIRRLEPGVYDIYVQADGYPERLAQRSVKLGTNESLHIDLAMEKKEDLNKEQNTNLKI